MKKKDNDFIMKRTKRMIVKAASLSILFASIMGTAAFAASQHMEHNGYGYLHSHYSNGMRNVSAGTIRGNSVDYAYLQVTSTYNNGSVYTYTSPITRGDKKYSSNYEWTEDYSSVHKLYSNIDKNYTDNNADNYYDIVYLFED